MSNQIKLFSPLKIRNILLRNRIVLSPLCMYSANNGVASNWQFAHLSTFARGGVGLVFTEATAVESRGRITPGCLGIWTDEQADSLKPITEFINSMGSVAGIQLAHAGRKGSATPPWEGGVPIETLEKSYKYSGWKTVGPSEIPLAEGWQKPQELSKNEIRKIITAFSDSTIRAANAGFKVLEIHGAHGYLIHSFLSSISNNRKDEYGGDLQNRMRFALEVTEAVRKSWPKDFPLFFRMSAVDNQGWKITDSVTLSRELKTRGVDVVDCSAGGITGAPAFRSKDDGSPIKSSGDRPLGFQVPYAENIKSDADIMTMAVGRIVYPKQAEDILNNNCADLIALGRELMHNPFWALHAAEKLNINDAFSLWPEQYKWAVVRRAELGQYK